MGAPGFCTVKQKKDIFIFNLQKLIASKMKYWQTNKNHNPSAQV